MKNLLSSIFILTLTLNLFAQKDGPITKAWDDVSTKEAFKQGDNGTVEIYIKIKGSDYEACKVKAAKAAVYIAIFQGYNANVEANIPMSTPMAKGSVYDQNLPYFDAFFADGGKYKEFVDKCDKHPNLLAEMKLDKKNVEANIVVKINKKNLQQRLLDDKIIQPLISSEMPLAQVLVIPDDSYLDKGNYSKEIDAGGYMTTVYDLVRGAKDPSIETAITTVASALTGEGSGFARLELAEAQSALEIKDAVNEMATGMLVQKRTPAEILNNRATWDYAIKINIKEEVNGTARNITFTIKIVDMYTLTSETATPITLVLASSGNRDQQITKAINGAIEDIRSRISISYKKKIDVGIEGRVEFYISKGSKSNFNTPVSLPEGEKEKLSEVVGYVLGELVSKDTQPQLDGVGSENERKYKGVIIPFETVKTTMGKTKKVKNTFENLGTQIEKQLATFLPGATFQLVPTKGATQVYIKY